MNFTRTPLLTSSAEAARGLLLLVALGLSLVGVASAAPIVTTDGGGNATGIDGLDVGGTIYYVDFVGFGQSYNAVFGGALDVTTEATAGAIIAAIEVVLDGSLAGGTADWQNNDIVGNTSTPVGADTDLYLPWHQSGSAAHDVADLDWAQPTEWNVISSSVYFSDDTGPSDTGWIRVSETSEATVPGPGTALLLMGGLVGLGLTRKRTNSRRPSPTT